MIRGKTHQLPFEPSFDLLDAGNALYHPNYLVAFDRARADALAAAGYPFHELWRDGFALAVRENKSEYFKPVLMGNQITILTSLLESSASTLRLLQRMVPRETVDACSAPFSEGEPSIDSKLVIHQTVLLLVCIRLDPLRPTRLPEKLREKLNL